MLTRSYFKCLKAKMNTVKSRVLAKQWRSTLYCPMRNYIVYYKPTETDGDAAEANPMRHFYQDSIIQEMTEIQRMMKLTMHEPRRFLNIKGIYPEIVEDFNFNALPEPSPTKIGEGGEEADIKLDQLDEDQAIEIIYEMNKDPNNIV